MPCRHARDQIWTRDKGTPDRQCLFPKNGAADCRAGAAEDRYAWARDADGDPHAWGRGGAEAGAPHASGRGDADGDPYASGRGGAEAGPCARAVGAAEAGPYACAVGAAEAQRPPAGCRSRKQGSSPRRFRYRPRANSGRGSRSPGRHVHPSPRRKERARAWQEEEFAS